MTWELLIRSLMTRENSPDKCKPSFEMHSCMLHEGSKSAMGSHMCNRHALKRELMSHTHTHLNFLNL